MSKFSVSVCKSFPPLSYYSWQEGRERTLARQTVYLNIISRKMPVRRNACFFSPYSNRDVFVPWASHIDVLFFGHFLLLVLVFSPYYSKIVCITLQREQLGSGISLIRYIRKISLNFLAYSLFSFLFIGAHLLWTLFCHIILLLSNCITHQNFTITHYM